MERRRASRRQPKNGYPHCQCAKLVHLKEYSAEKPPAAIGDGQVNWAEVFEVCEGLHQPEWYIFEQEEKGYDVWDSAAQSLAYLQELSW